MSRTEAFIREFRDADVGALALKMRQYPDVDAAFALQQIEGWQRARVKMPELAGIEGWWWPKRMSLEQCSSEVTARYKRRVLGGKEFEEFIDLTGGLGVDTYYLSEGCDEVHYVERDEELCRLAEHNFGLAGRRVQVHCGEAEEFLNGLRVAAFAGGDLHKAAFARNYRGQCVWGNRPPANDALADPAAMQCPQTHRPHDILADGQIPSEENISAGGREERVVFVDPARRDSHGGKVFRLQDCTPDVTVLLPQMRAVARRILLKLSPMLDITEAIRSLGGAAEVHVVAVRNEVKEVLVLLEDGRDSLDPEIWCVNLETNEEAFCFRRSDEVSAGDNRPADGWVKAEEEMLLVEPNAAIVKAGAYRLFGERYGLKKLGVNTHLYVRRLERLDGLAGLERIPGRVFRVREAKKEELKGLKQANVVCRNYPLTAEALRKQLKLKDGGEMYVIGARVGEKPVLFVGQRQFLHTLR